MTILPKHVITIMLPSSDPFSRSLEWKRESIKDVSSFVRFQPSSSEHRVYVIKHSCAWKFGQVLWAAIQTIFTLGLMLISETGRRTWQQACSGKEWAVVHITNFPGFDSVRNLIQPQPPIVPIFEPTKTLAPPLPVPASTPKPSMPPVSPAVMHNLQPFLNPISSPLVSPKQVLVPGQIIQTGTPAYAAVDFTSFSAKDKAVYLLIEEAYKKIDEIEQGIGKKSSPKIASIWNQKLVASLILVYNEILETFKEDQYLKEFDGKPENKKLCDTEIGKQLKNFKENIYTSIISRLLAFRNLVKTGPEILDEMIENAFAPEPASYPKGKGLQKLQSLSHGYFSMDTWITPKKFPAAKYEFQIIDLAKILINEFKARFKDYGDKLALGLRNWNNWEKSVHLSNKDDHRKVSHTKYPVWKHLYKGKNQATTLSYYINVPDVNWIVTNILRDTLFFAQSYLIRKSTKKELVLCSLYEWKEELEISKRLIDLPPKEQAILLYGNNAVEKPITSNDLASLLDDETILPPVNVSASNQLDALSRLSQIPVMTNGVFISPAAVQSAEWVKTTQAAHEAKVAAWKPQAIQAYVAKAQQQKWLNALYHDGTTYKPFDQQCIESAVDRMIMHERTLAASGVGHKTIRFI